MCCNKRFSSSMSICILVLAMALVSSIAAISSAGQGFYKTLTLAGITFHVSCAKEGSLNDVIIVPSGLEEVNTPIHLKDVDGSVVGAQVADINNDGSPELYVYVTSAGSGSYGSLIAYSANNNKSLSEIYLAALADDKVNHNGYMGHDSFKLDNNRLVRIFPLYKDGDANVWPGGGSRRLEYSLVAGEAAWQLKLIKSTDQPAVSP